MSTTVIYNDEQEEIRDVARRLVGSDFGSERVRAIMEEREEFTHADWQAIAELGWVGISLPEELGGAGYGPVERCILLEEMGRAVMPGPYLSSAVLAVDLIAAAATPEIAGGLLGPIVEGATRAAVVVRGDLHAGPTLPGGVVAVPGAGGFALSGDGGVVVDGDTADLLIVVAAVDGGVGLFAVAADADGVARSTRSTIDQTRRFAAISFDGATARRLDHGTGTTSAIERALDGAAIALSAEMIGGAQRLIAMTVDYAKDREQFGVPIGTFQGIKHRLADLAVEVDAARELVYYAADVLDGGDADQLPALAAATKAAASDAYVHAGGEAIQLHGGIGFTWEHDAHLFYKRALVSARILGTPVDQRARLKELLGV